jgi:hypothetical protein
MKSLVPSTAASFTLPEVQVFKDKNTILWGKSNQPFRGSMAEIPSAAGLLPLQMFETPRHRFGALVFYLSGFKLPLQPLDGFPVSLILYPPFKPTDKEFLVININGNQSISLIEVNTDWEDTLHIWNFNGKGNIADKFIVFSLYCHAVYFFGISQHCLKVAGDGIGKAFPASYRPDRKQAILPEVSIPTSLTNKKQGKRVLELNRPFELMPIAFSGNISPSDETNSSAGELARKAALNRVVNSFVQRECFERFTAIPAYWRYLISNFGKHLERCLKVAIRLYNYLSSAVANHQEYLTTILYYRQIFSGKEVCRNLSVA